MQSIIYNKLISDEFLVDLCVVAACGFVKDSSLEILANFIKDRKYKYAQFLKSNINSETIDVDSSIENNRRYQILDVIETVVEKAKESHSTVRVSNLFTERPLINDFIEEVDKKVEYLARLDLEVRNTEADKLLGKVIDVISSINVLENLEHGINNYEELVNKIKQGKITSIYGLIKDYKELIQRSYLNLVNAEAGEGSNIYERHHLLIFGDSKISESIAKYIVSDYGIFKTGFSFIDDVTGGFESDSITTIAAPSNQGKSLFLLQLAYGIIRSNPDKFSKNDAILHVTLEDNRIKLSRRIFSVFGDFPPRLIRQLYNTMHEKSREAQRNPILYKKFLEFVDEVIKTLERFSIESVTRNKVKYIIQDHADSAYSTTELFNTLMLLKLKNIHVRLIFLDYIDLMTSSRRYEKEYDEHGQIIKDLRAIAKEFHIPIITVTQLRRDAENPKVTLSNDVMGDSYKKVRFSDYIIMMRHVYNEDAFEVYCKLAERAKQEYAYCNLQQTINNNDIFYNELRMDKLQNVRMSCTPVEFLYTKVKDADKRDKEINKQKLLFYRNTLKLYDDINELQQAFQRVEYLSEKLKNLIEIARTFESYYLKEDPRQLVSNVFNTDQNSYI